MSFTGAICLANSNQSSDNSVPRECEAILSGNTGDSEHIGVATATEKVLFDEDAFSGSTIIQSTYKQEDIIVDYEWVTRIQSGDLQYSFAQEIDAYLDLGRKSFYKRGDFVFERNIRRDSKASGIISDGIYRGYYNGRTYILKRLPNRGQITKLKMLHEIRNAKIMEFLGIGPKVELVLWNGRYFLISPLVPGVNIKDILSSRNTYKFDTLDAINEMLGTDFVTYKTGIAAFANHLLSLNNFTSDLRELADLIESSGYGYAKDFQFMVDEQGVIVIIDSADFVRYREIDGHSPASEVISIIEKLRELSRL